MFFVYPLGGPRAVGIRNLMVSGVVVSGGCTLATFRSGDIGECFRVGGSKVCRGAPR